VSSRKVVVVTGGAGFVGSHLIDALVENYDVLCIDNYVTGNPENLANAFKKAEAYGTKLVCAVFDVSSDQLVSEICRMMSVHFGSRQVWAYANLACPASPVAYQADPIATLDTCYKGTMNAMQFAKMGARVLHASTSEVYGDPEVHPQRETYKGSVNTWGPRACYDEGKRVAETICYEHLVKGYDVRVVRIFNSFGTRMHVDDGRVLTNFIRQTMKNEDVTVYGNGSQTRSMCYVSDTVKGLQAVLETNIRVCEPINIGNPCEITILDLAKKVLEMFPNSGSKIVFRDLPTDDPTRRCPDISKAKSLGWTPEISLEEGLKMMIDEFVL